VSSARVLTDSARRVKRRSDEPDPRIREQEHEDAEQRREKLIHVHDVEPFTN
jgi:hypothetical protein